MIIQTKQASKYSAKVTKIYVYEMYKKCIKLVYLLYMIYNEITSILHKERS